MKKQRYSRISTVFRSVFDFRAWADYDRMKSFTLYLYNGFKKMFIPQPKNRTLDVEANQAFKAEMAKLHLTEQEITAKGKGLFRLSILMCLAAIGLFGYAIYHMVYGSFLAVMVSVVLTFVALALAFRYHFWYFQIKEQKLGCSFKEWYRQGLLGDK